MRFVKLLDSGQLLFRILNSSDKITETVERKAKGNVF